MKVLLTLLILMSPLHADGESFFFIYKDFRSPKKKIEGGSLHMVYSIEKIAPPDATRIFAVHQGLGPGREYQIQINLKSIPEKGRLPSLKLGDDVITDGVSLSQFPEGRSPPAYHLESDDPKQIERWCKLLGRLLNLSDDRILIDLTKAEQGGAGEPATRSEWDSEGGDKPQTESERRSR